MEAMIQSTPETTTVDGARCRLWKGITKAGVPFVAYIAAVRVDKIDDQSQFEMELREVHPSTDVSDVIPLRFIL